MQLRGSVALVTGASSGIGRASALRLCDAEARVLVHGRDPARTDEVAHRIHGVSLRTDLVRVDAARRLAEDAVAVHGRVDLVVANAGAGWSGPFTAMSYDEIDYLIGLDLRAPVALVRALLPGMVERGSGHVCLVGSVAGSTGVAGEAVYAACKAGLAAFAESLRLELAGSGVGVSLVVPAAVRTDFFDRRGRSYDRRFPRPVAADKVAAAVVESIRHDQAEAWVPRWVRAAAGVRAVAPSAYRRLAQRYGEPVRITGRRSGKRR